MMKIDTILKKPAAVWALGFLSLLPASAGTIFTDDFETALGFWYFYNSNASGTVWTRGNYGESDAPLISGSAMRNLGGVSANTRAFRQWFTDPVTLSQVGDYIQVDFAFKSSATRSALTVALFETAHEFTANQMGGLTPVSDSAGYSFDQTWTTGSYGYRKIIGTGVERLGLLTLGEKISDGCSHHCFFRITRLKEGVLLEVSLDASTLSASIDEIPVTYTFNSLSLNSGDVAVFDNVSVATGSVSESERIQTLKKYP
jgi:hypothetical protein